MRYFKYNPKKDVKEFLDDTLDEILQDSSFDFENIKSDFENLFRLLNAAFGEDVFKKYYSDKSKFQGKFLESAFEAITVGVSHNLNKYSLHNLDELKERIIQIWSENDFIKNSGSGTNASMRIPRIIPFSINHFA